MARKQRYDYFQTFTDMVEYSCKAAKMLHDTFKAYDAHKLLQIMDEIHKIEHSADILKHEMMKRLVKEFITPIERGDIIELAQEIDEVTDNIEDVLLRAYMFNITSIREEALSFATLIMSCCNAMKRMMLEFSNFHKSSVIYNDVVEINRLEEEGDKLYTKAMRRLYTTSSNPIEVLIWSEAFDRLEKCCDACEHVANSVESVIMKNS